MSRIARTFGLVCAIECGFTGCATYWKNRGKDLIDPFGFGLDVGFRLGVNARATQFAQLGAAGVMVMEFPMVRFVGRNGFDESESVELGIAPFYHFRSVNGHVRKLVLGETHIEEAPSVVLWYRPETRDYQRLQVQKDSRSYTPERKSYERNYDRRLFDIGISAYALGARENRRRVSEPR